MSFLRHYRGLPWWDYVTEEKEKTDVGQITNQLLTYFPLLPILILVATRYGKRVATIDMVAEHTTP